VVEPRDDHGDDGDDQKMIKCFTFGKEEREKQNLIEIKAKVYHRGLFSCSRHYRGCDHI
jgi:hypothetical protein